MLAKTEAESKTLWDSLKVWEREEDRKARSRAGKPTTSSKKKEDGEATEVWANVRFTDEFCMAKIDGSPYWPAKKCKAKDEELAKSLHAVGRTLVSLIGEKGGLRAVRLEDIKSFDGSVVEDDLEEYPKSIRTQLDEVSVFCCLFRRHDIAICLLKLFGIFMCCSAWLWLVGSLGGEATRATGAIVKKRRWPCRLI